MAEAERVRLGEVADLLTGHPFSSSGFVNGGIRLLRGDNIAPHTVRWAGAKRWPDDRAADLTRYQLSEADVVLAMDRPLIEAGLKVAVLRRSDVPSLLVQRVARLRAGPRLDQRYLAYLLGNPKFIAYLRSVETGSAVPHISGPQIANYECELPDLATQRAIAEVLGALDDKIDANARIVADAPRLAAALLQRAAVGGEEFRVGDVAEVRKGLSYTGAGLSDDGMPMVNLANAAAFGGFKREGFKYYVGDYKPRHVAHGGDLLVANTEQTWRNEILGWPMLLPSDIHEALFTHHTSLLEFGAGNAWLRLPLWAHLFSADARARVEGMAHGTTVAAIPSDALMDMSFQAPPQDSPVLAEAQALIERSWAAERESAALAGVRDALLPELMSGRLAVREAESVVSDAV